VSAIAEWLTSLGLSEYTGRFMENGIDTSVLPDLTDQDLKDLGVLLGHRRKMLRAIRDLGNVSVSVAAPAAPVETEPARKDDAERRQLTVMLTDLVGSTALSTQLDPEDMRAMIGAYHKCVAETVARFDGFVAKYMGDGVLVYFGYPHAHEDDAERAVRAGLALVEAVGKLQVQEPLWPPAPRPEEAASLFSSTIRGRRAFHLRRPAAPDTFSIAPDVAHRALTGGSGASARVISGDAVDLSAGMDCAADGEGTSIPSWSRSNRLSLDSRPQRVGPRSAIKRVPVGQAARSCLQVSSVGKCQ
jgi:hypothetical protein